MQLGITRKLLVQQNISTVFWGRIHCILQSTCWPPRGFEGPNPLWQGVLARVSSSLLRLRIEGTDKLLILISTNKLSSAVQ